MLEGHRKILELKTQRLPVILPQWKSIVPAKHTGGSKKVTSLLTSPPLEGRKDPRQDQISALTSWSSKEAGVGPPRGGAGLCVLVSQEVTAVSRKAVTQRTG